MYDRGERVAEVLQHLVSGLLREAKDPGLKGLLTVTSLKLTRDRKSAVIFYSVLGSREQKESTAKALERMIPFLRRMLRETMSIRVIPKLQFEYDSTPERAQRIEDILAGIEREREPKDEQP